MKALCTRGIPEVFREEVSSNAGLWRFDTLYIGECKRVHTSSISMCDVYQARETSILMQCVRMRTLITFFSFLCIVSPAVDSPAHLFCAMYQRGVKSACFDTQQGITSSICIDILPLSLLVRVTVITITVTRSVNRGSNIGKFV